MCFRFLELDLVMRRIAARAGLDGDQGHRGFVTGSSANRTPEARRLMLDAIRFSMRRRDLGTCQDGSLLSA